MKAIVCDHYGPPEALTLADLPELVPGPGEVVIDVRACGVNFPDTLIIQGLYQVKPPLPFSPGSDVAGVVRAVGEGVRGLRPGDAVVTLMTHGGFAEQVLAPAAMCLPKPPGMDFITAAAFTMTYGTSYHALKDRARLRPGESLLVLGAAGGVGLTAVELGKHLGARVIAAASSDEKLAVCREYGADEIINYAREDLKTRLKELTGGAGVDVVYDPVGGAFSETALRGTAWNGRYLVVGFAAGDIPRIPLNLPLLKGCEIVGVFWGGFATREPQANGANMRELMDLHARGLIRPRVQAVYPLAEAPRALRALADRQVLGKVVVQVSAG